MIDSTSKRKQKTNKTGDKMKNLSISILAFVATVVFTFTQASTINNNDVLKEMNTSVQHSSPINFTSTTIFIKSQQITIAQLQKFNDEASQVRCSPYPDCKYEFSTQKETNNT